jgi:hypothetical protein
MYSCFRYFINKITSIAVFPPVLEFSGSNGHFVLFVCRDHTGKVVKSSLVSTSSLLLKM